MTGAKSRYGCGNYAVSPRGQEWKQGQQIQLPGAVGHAPEIGRPVRASPSFLEGSYLSISEEAMQPQTNDGDGFGQLEPRQMRRAEENAVSGDVCSRYII